VEATQAQDYNLACMMTAPPMMRHTSIHFLDWTSLGSNKNLPKFEGWTNADSNQCEHRRKRVYLYGRVSTVTPN